MRDLGGIVAALLLGACSTEAVPAPSVASSARGVQVDSDIGLAPTEPTPAFLPARGGACPRAYRPVDGSCVHHAYVAADDAALRHALDAYRRGAAPPMLGQAKPQPVAPERRAAHDPGSLARRTEDAGLGRERRLAELDALIAAAKEKLRERDERSKARRVESPRRAPQAAVPSPGPLPALASATAGAAPAADSTQARLDELSQLTSQLGPEQLQAMTAQLSQAGMDVRQLQQLLQSVQSMQGASPQGGDSPR